ncbi:hypothetical protein HYX19_04225 [Candidatus Woesearchaeota archaeon]|nr:hypothetical protein [Candidatus Woesearchaeota archaeon]
MVNDLWKKEINGLVRKIEDNEIPILGKTKAGDHRYPSVTFIIESKEGTSFAPFPRRFSSEERDILLGSNVEYCFKKNIVPVPEDASIEHVAYELKILDGKYKDWKIEAAIYAWK